MKVKNVMFSGFAAAIFATVCGAAVAADVQLISKDYADTNLQAKLTPGQGIDIETTDEGTTISADVDLSTLATKEELAKKLTGTAIQGSAVEYDTESGVYTITDDNTEYAGEGYVNIVGNKISVTADGQVAQGNTGLVTGGTVHAITSALDTRLGTAEGKIEEIDAVVDTLQGVEGGEDGIVTKVTNLERTVGDENSGLVKQVATNTEEIALKANSEDVYAKNEVYTKGEVNTELAKKQNELTAANVVSGSDNVRVGFADGVYTISATDNNTEYGVGTATTEGLTKLYTATGEAQDGTMTQAAIKIALEGKLATDGTAAKATADANGANIADTYATKAVVAGKLSSIKTAGSYLVNFGADGNVSYAPIQILGSNGQPITLTGENAVAPSEN